MMKLALEVSLKFSGRFVSSLVHGASCWLTPRPEPQVVYLHQYLLRVWSELWFSDVVKSDHFLCHKCT